MADSPSLTSGRRGIKDPVVELMNVIVNGAPLKLLFIKDSLKVPGRLTKHDMQGEDVNLGFDIRSAGAKEGNLDVQLNYPTDALALPAHIVRITKGTVVEHFGIADASWPNERNSPVRGSLSLIQMINPYFSGLLSPDLGDTLQQTFSKAAGDTTIDPKPLNHRTGSTKAYSATQADGSALPTGLAINASTGVLSITALSIAVGTYTIKVVGTDTLTTLPSDHPWRQLDCEQTLILTVTV